MDYDDIWCDYYGEQDTKLRLAGHPGERLPIPEFKAHKSYMISQAIDRILERSNRFLWGIHEVE